MTALAILRIIRTIVNAYLAALPEQSRVVHSEATTPATARHVHLLMRIQTLLIENNINEN